jgi:dUTP pyrophosphatase
MQQNNTRYQNCLPTLVANARVKKLNPSAEVPYKERPSDIGFDVTLIGRTDNRTEDTTHEVGMFSTGLQIQPPAGYYFQVVARSSLHKAGYVLATGVSIIDPEYTGELLVPLIKFSDNAEDLELPFRAVQLVLCPAIYVIFNLTDTMPITDRGGQGFGSTGTLPKKHSALTLSTATSAAAHHDDGFEVVTKPRGGRRTSQMF